MCIVESCAVLCCQTRLSSHRYSIRLGLVTIKASYCLIHIISKLIRSFSAFPGALHRGVSFACGVSSLIWSGCSNLTLRAFGCRWGSWRAPMNTWVWKEQEEARRCWWVTTHFSEHLRCTIPHKHSYIFKLSFPCRIQKTNKHSFMCLFKQLNAAASLCNVLLLTTSNCCTAGARGKSQLLCSAVMRKATGGWEKTG